ncbi:MAG: peptidyl-prolyl cis-trans isomerase [Cyclobacteriaceae bacterium]
MLVSCEYFKQKNAPGEVPVARAGDKYYYRSDLVRHIPLNISREDSTRLAEKLIGDWVSKELMVNKAEIEISLDQDDVEERVQAYRYALVAHEFEKIYVNSHLSLDVSQEEINAYYQERSDNFILRQNIIKGLFAKVPRSASGIEQFRRNLRNYPNSNFEDIRDFCFQFAIESFLDDSLWVNFNEVVQGTPLDELNDKTKFVQSNTFSETRDEEFVYFLKISEYKVSNEISPLEYVREDIESIIINKRKIALKKELEKSIYEEALATNQFEIFRD